MGSEDNKKLGYIQLFRSFTRWEWFTDRNTLQVFIYCLLSANHKQKKYKGTVIERGSFVSSYARIADECNLTREQVRTAFKHLKDTEEVTCIFNGKGLIISVKNYGKYQDEPTHIPSKSHAYPKQLPPNNNDNKYNKYNNILSAPSAHEYDEDFLSFWELYPKKISKWKTYEYFKKANLYDELDSILNGLKYLIEIEYSKKERQFIPDPITFLMDERWKDYKEESTEIYVGDY